MATRSAGFDIPIRQQPVVRYQGEASFVRRLAHILNFIVKECLAVNNFFHGYIPESMDFIGMNVNTG